jgi:hypothetical protein
MLAGAVTDGQRASRPASDVRITKRELNIREAWQIGRNDPDAISLLHSPWFRTAQLTFTLAAVGNGVCITHDLAVTFQFPWTILIPVLALFKKRALGADLDSLRCAIDEGLDLTAPHG